EREERRDRRGSRARRRGRDAAQECGGGGACGGRGPGRRGSDLGGAAGFPGRASGCDVHGSPAARSRRLDLDPAQAAAGRSLAGILAPGPRRDPASRDVAPAGGCGTRAAEEEKAVEPVVPVRLEPLGSRSFEDVIDANGAWRSQGELIVAAPFSGVVERISARPGDPVAAGQAVGSLTTLESHAALRGALALQGAARDSASRNEARAALELA